MNTDRTEIVARASKYGTALDEAWEQGVSVEKLGEWIRGQGIENICKERRRRNTLQKPRRDTLPEATAGSEMASGGTPVLPSGNSPLSDITIRHVLKLNDQVAVCSDPEKQNELRAKLEKFASHSKKDSQTLVKVAQEQHIIMRSIEEWGDDQKGREIGRLRAILHWNDISY
jgi:hypothetical protein